MNTETFYTMSNSDGLLLEVLVSEPGPEVVPKGVIQFVHGSSEHKERYQPFMECMTAAGYACIIHDHRGHGNSVRNPEDLGYMYGTGTEGFLSDIHQITVMAKKRWPDLPIVQFGHGMGSLAVRCCAQKWEEDISCMILSGFPSRNPFTSSGLFFAKFQREDKRKRTMQKILKQITLVPYDKRFPGESTDFHWICRNQAIVDAYNEDPLCGFDLSVEGYEIYLQLMRTAHKKYGWKTEKPDLPILFIGGADDPYIGGPAPFHQSIRSMRGQGYRNVRGKLYPGLRHEIFNEEERGLVFKDLEKYLERVLGDKTDH